MPALFVVILVSLPFAWNLLLPSQLVDYAKSILSALAFGSNFYWDSTLQEYGAESALLKPFLHTWTLAVEEQYYIIFPLILLVIYKWAKLHTIVILTATFLLSLQFAHVWTGIDASSSFYMLPSRFWELLAGSLLANILHLHPQKDNDALLNRTMPVLGLYLIVYSMVFVDFDAHHPGFITLLPVIGTVLIIWFANENDLVTKVLSSKLFVAVGLISYSLYLWHYPIFAFGRLMDMEPTWHDKAKWTFLTFALSIGSYFIVEKPYRNKEKVSSKLMLLTLVGAAILIAFFCTLLIFNADTTSKQGVTSKYNPDNQALKEMSWSFVRQKPKSWDLSPEEAHKTKLLLVGNSHSKDIYNAIFQTPELMRSLQLNRLDLQVGEPKADLLKKLNSKLFYGADIVMISTRYSYDYDNIPAKAKQKWNLQVSDIDRLGWFIDEIKSRGKSVVITSNTVEFNLLEGRQIFDSFVRRGGDITHPMDITSLKKLFYENIDWNKQNTLNKRVKAIADAHGAIYLEKSDFICDFAEKTCDGITDEGFKSLYDYGHYTLEGAKFFGQRMYQIGWLESAIGSKAESSSITAQEKVVEQ